MKLNQLLQKSFRLLTAMLLVGAIIIPTNSAFSQLAAGLPRLSLTGVDNSYNTNFYPDGRLTVAPSKSKDYQSEVLVPVFISFKEMPDPLTHSTKHIYSFEMKLKYDSQVFKPVKIQSFHPTLDDPKYRNDDFRTVGAQFQYDWNTYADTNFLQWLDINGEQNTYGAVMKITGISAQPLPSTLDANGNEIFKPFFYVVMKVLPTLAEEDSRLLNKLTWLLIDADSIRYNDVWTISKPNYPNIAGIDMERTNELWTNEPYRKGTLMAKVQNKFPAFDFFMQKLPGVMYSGEKNEAIVPIVKDDLGYGQEFEIVDPISVDWQRTKDEFKYGERTIQIRNSVIGTRMSEVMIETDQPWLEVATYNVEDPNFSFNYNEKGYFPYLDNGILGSIYLPTDKNNIIPAQPQIFLNIRCNPDKIDPLASVDPEGTYVGYITFKSRDALHNPVKLKVTFNLLRNAYEPDLYPQEMPVGSIARHTGIRLNIRTAYVDETKNLVFGTAPRATEGIDTLMGERAYLQPMTTTGFDARFFSLTPEINAKAPNGFMDALPDINRPDYNSRDIRDINDTLQSLTYYVKFNTPRYPLYITWNVNDFPEGSILYIKDLQTRGDRINVNMREGSTVGTDGTMSYTFTDATLNDFIIEYTLPKIFEYDSTDNGFAAINKGWNLLSLPVRPTNAAIKSVYPNSVNNNVLTFFPSGWEQEAGNLKPGQGFFILYNNIIDRKFAGLQIRNIGPEYGDKIRIIKGWNLIGALSFPVSVNNVSFAQYNPNFPIPDLAFVRFYGFWRYITARGYQQVNMLEPGFGYFIKAGKGSGEQEDVAQSALIESYLRISPTSATPKAIMSGDFKEDAKSASAKLNVFDNNQAYSTIYLSNDKKLNSSLFELPPALGENFFDIRFEGNTYLSNNDNSTVQLYGVKYPVSISATDNNSDLFFYDAVTNELLGVITKNSNKNLEINKTMGNTINVVKGNTELKVYPNPVANVAQVSYYVPANGYITVKIFNSLGNEVSNVFQGIANEGLQNQTFNVNNLATGTYFIKVIGADFTNVTSFTLVK